MDHDRGDGGLVLLGLVMGLACFAFYMQGRMHGIKAAIAAIDHHVDAFLAGVRKERARHTPPRVERTVPA